MTREFASLTAQEALHIAIFVEERNRVLYGQFAELFSQFGDRDSEEIAAVFRDMADEEQMHGSFLQERYSARYGDDPCSTTEEDIRDLIELPQLQDGNLFAIARSGASLMPRRHALAVAIEAERAAQRYYAYLTEHTADPELRALYFELSEFENDHVDKLQYKMDLLPGPAASG